MPSLFGMIGFYGDQGKTDFEYFQNHGLVWRGVSLLPPILMVVSYVLSI